MQAHTWSLLDLAWQSGVRYFDAARSYRLAEQFLGTWLSARLPPRDRITVGSKWGYTYTANWQPQARLACQIGQQRHRFFGDPVLRVIKQDILES